MKWASLDGQITEKKNEIIFNGKIVTAENQEPRSSYNIILSDQSISNGKVSAEIMFKEIGNFATQCEIIVFYDPTSKNFVSAGLGGAFRMYSIRAFVNKWDEISLSGVYENLKPDVYYKVEVDVKGSRVTLKVDGIVVSSANVPYSLSSSQVGLFCLGASDIHIRNFNVQSEKAKVFVVMQFTSPYNELYEEVIKPVCIENGLSVVRADETYGPGLIIADITREITESRIVVAEISPINSNVYYEVGYAHALNIPTILIAEKGVKLPFDVSPFRTLFYENSIAGKKKIEEGFKKHILAVLADRDLNK